jgi:hypothetical protein
VEAHIGSLVVEGEVHILEFMVLQLVDLVVVLVDHLPVLVLVEQIQIIQELML